MSRFHRPAAFRRDDPVDPLAFVAAHPFVTLITPAADAEPRISHLPVSVFANERRITGHLGAANPHGQALEGASATLVALGPHAYASPTCYRTPAQVPTWNHTAVHVSGRTRRLPAAAAADEVRRLSERHEAAGGRRFDGLPPGRWPPPSS